MRRRWRISVQVGALVLAGGIGSAVAAAFLARSAVASAIPPSDSGLQQALAQLNAATPEEEARLASRLAKASSGLPLASDFDAWLKGWSGSWTEESRSSEWAEPVERRSYVIAHNDRDLRAWADILASLKALCAEPGVTVDRLDLVLALDGDHFAMAQVAFTARVRR
jgi:hypothetical protein